MAIICCICKKKQSGFINDFPLSDEYFKKRICRECDIKRNQLNLAVDKCDKELYEDTVNYFNKLKNDIGDADASDYLTKLIESSRFILDNGKDEFILIENEKQKNLEKKFKEVKITTTHSFEGYMIKEYKGIISSECVLGTGIISDLSAGLSDLLGDVSEKLQDKIRKAREMAMDSLICRALENQCNAIIKVDIRHTVFSGNIIGIVISGTGVVMEEEVEVNKTLNLLERLSELKINNLISDKEFENLKLRIINVNL